MTDGRATKEAVTRFVLDAAFHAEVEIAIQTTEKERGVRFDKQDRLLACEAAAVALVLHGEAA